MALAWYPGHMKAARQALAKAIPSTDVVLEVLDARAPRASSNPVLTELRRGKPCIKLLTKSDLADPAVTSAWVHALRSKCEKVLELALTKGSAADTRARVVEACRALAPHRNTRAKPVRAMVVGIPNVGKSTLINTLVDRKVTRVGDQPGITTAPQVVTALDGMVISDNAGVLWPRIEEGAVLRLGLAGAIPDSEMDYESVGVFAAGLLLARYPGAVCARYGLDAAPATPEQLLERIGRRHGALRAGGIIDARKASSVLVHDFRSGKLGRITLEHPDDAQPEPVDAGTVAPDR